MVKNRKSKLLAGKLAQLFAAEEKQASNMDTIFNFFLHCRAAHIITRNTMDRDLRRLNMTLYALGQELVGKAKVTEILDRAGPPINNLVPLFNNTAAIYQPPYCLNIRRVYDIVSEFGVLKYSALRRSMVKADGSSRNIVHIRLNSEAAMSLVTHYWSLIDTAIEHTEDPFVRKM